MFESSVVFMFLVFCWYCIGEGLSGGVVCVWWW